MYPGHTNVRTTAAVLCGKAAHHRNNIAEDMNILLVALSVWGGFMFAILNYRVAINLRCALEDSLCQSTSHDRYCVIITKSSTSRKERKVDIYFKTIKRSCTVSPHCPHSPNPYSIRMSATSRTPRRAYLPVTFTRSSETIHRSRSFPFAEVIFCPSS